MATDRSNGIVYEGAGVMKDVMLELMLGELGNRLRRELYKRPATGQPLQMKPL